MRKEKKRGINVPPVITVERQSKKIKIVEVALVRPCVRHVQYFTLW